MTSHKAKAEQLLKEAKQFEKWSWDSTGTGIEVINGWARRATYIIAEAQVHATLAVLEAGEQA